MIRRKGDKGRKGKGEKRKNRKEKLKKMVKIEGISNEKIYYNLSEAELYILAIKYEEGVGISSKGALMCESGTKTGRCPKDKRIVREEEIEKDIWWGEINIPLAKESFDKNKERACGYFNECQHLFVVDVYAGKGEYKKKVRVVTGLAYHALFMGNMFERTKDEGNPDFIIYNAGGCLADMKVEGVKSTTSINICFSQKEMVILGTLYAGEMKKGIFSILHYYYPKQYQILTLHSSANMGQEGDVSLFFGLSGTGKTTLSMDKNRQLIGDDELAWADEGVFNIESGCYAKIINLSAEDEPYIYNAIKFGTVLENVVYDKATYEVNFKDSSITENTRAAYPMSYVPNACESGRGGQPKNIIFLTCDAFGLLPPVAKLTFEQALYYFIAGYTTLIPSTVTGQKEFLVEFSPCFGDAFLTLPPEYYVSLFADKLNKIKPNVWLVNTGWYGGDTTTGSRYPIAVSRTILNRIHDNSLLTEPTYIFPHFNLQVPLHIQGIDPKYLKPQNLWKDNTTYQKSLIHLIKLFQKQMNKFNLASSILNSGPLLPN